MLGISALNLGLLSWNFRKDLKGTAAARDSAGKDLKSALKERSVIILSLFFFLYVGAEVTAGGTYHFPRYLNFPARTNTPHRMGRRIPDPRPRRQSQRSWLRSLRLLGRPDRRPPGARRHHASARRAAHGDVLRAT